MYRHMRRRSFAALRMTLVEEEILRCAQDDTGGGGDPSPSLHSGLRLTALRMTLEEEEEILRYAQDDTGRS